MQALWQKFCEESTMHGFLELYNSRSMFSKCFWLIIITTGGVMTTFQVYLVIASFNSSPTKTQIATLDKDIGVVYSPYSFTAENFVHWINLSKIADMRITYETFLYAMSYYQTVYSRIQFDVAKARYALKAVMEEHHTKSVYHLLSSFASENPYNLSTAGLKIKPILAREFGGQTKFLAVMGDYNSISLKTEYRIFSDFSKSVYGAELQTIYNQSYGEEYKMYKLGKNQNELGVQIQFNPTAKENMFMDLDFTAFDYEYYMKGTSYQWLSLPNKPCTSRERFNFYMDCDYECSLLYNNLSRCELYFVSDNVTSKEMLENLPNRCQFDKTLVHASGENEYGSCVDECMDTCTEWSYDFSQVLYPRVVDESETITGTVTVTFDDPKNTLVVAIVPSFTWDDAVANIGGLLGLWIGGSIMSFIQIAYIFCCYPLETKWLERGINKVSVGGTTTIAVQTIQKE